MAAVKAPEAALSGLAMERTGAAVVAQLLRDRVPARADDKTAGEACLGLAVAALRRGSMGRC